MRLNKYKNPWYNALIYNLGGEEMLQELYHGLINDMKQVGIPIDFNLELKSFSKTYYGRYDPNSNKITVYIYEDKSCTRMYSYEEILMTCIHEAVHSIQWHDKSFVRIKGVMHDADFYRLYNMYSDKAKSILLLREVKHDYVFEPSLWKAPVIHCRNYS